jgi:membrane protease YdiL (CAAX protease family)
LIRLKGYTKQMSGAESAGETVTGVLGVLFLFGCTTTVGLLAWSVSHPPPWHRRIRMLTNRPWRALDVGLVLCVVAIGQITTEILPTPNVQDDSCLSFAQFVTQTMLAFHGAVAVAVWFLFMVRQMDSRHAFGVRRGRTTQEVIFAIIGNLAAFPIICLAAFLAGLILNAMGQQQTFQQVITMVAAPGQSIPMRVYLCVLAVVVAPVVEETLFRGMALPVLTRYLGFPAAVAITSLVFALMHGHVPSLAPLFVLAVSFSLAYTLTGSLRVPIVMHAVFNAVNIGNVLLFPDIVNNIAP